MYFIGHHVLFGALKVASFGVNRFLSDFPMTFSLSSAVNSREMPTKFRRESERKFRGDFGGRKTSLALFYYPPIITRRQAVTSLLQEEAIRSKSTYMRSLRLHPSPSKFTMHKVFFCTRQDECII